MWEDRCTKTQVVVCRQQWQQVMDWLAINCNVREIVRIYIGDRSRADNTPGVHMLQGRTDLTVLRNGMKICVLGHTGPEFQLYLWGRRGRFEYPCKLILTIAFSKFLLLF